MAGVRDYSTTADSNLSVGGVSIAEGWARASVNNAYREGMADLANLLLDQGGGTATTGSSNAYLLDLPTAPTAYADNMLFVCKLHAAVTGASTINISGLGVKAFKKLQDGVAADLVAGDGPAGHRPVCVYSSADNAVLMLLSAPTFTQAGGGITWSITDRMKQQVYLLDFIPQSEHAAILNSTSTYDCSAAFEAAMNSISVPVEDNPVPFMGGPEVIFPYGTCYFDSTIEIKKTMTLTGQGKGHRSAWASRLEFRAGITGITVNSRTTYRGTMDPPVSPPPGAEPLSKGGDCSTIRNLKLTSKSLGAFDPTLNATGEGCAVDGGGAILWDNDHHGMGHGIWVRAACLIEYCNIQYFPQHGIYVRAVAQGAPPLELYGNANLTQIYHTACITNGGCGLYIDGPDTNACLFYGMDLASNRLSGIHDSCLIGNTHIMHHTDINGKDGLCSYSEDGITSWRYYVRDAERANNNALAWAPSTAYTTTNGGSMVRNAGNLYRCILPGTSAAAGGPTGTATAIIDGTTRWTYVVADAGIRIPPSGHAQSADVWAKVWPNLPGQANPDVHPFYPIYPNVSPGGSSLYRLGHNIWFDQGSARNTLIGLYVEANMPHSLIKAPSIVISGTGQALDAASTVIKYDSSTTGAIIEPALTIPSKTSATVTRRFNTSISVNPGDGLTMQVTDDGSAILASASPFGYVWDELTGTWMLQHAHSASRVAQRFTTTLNTLTGGRADAIGAGNTMFQQGIWLGRAATFSRHLTMAEAMPTTGQWAAGDLVLNAQPLMGEPWGWRCILTGDFAATPPVFQPLRDGGSQQSIADVAFTLTPGTSPHHTRHTGTMTANRAVTLSTTGALQGLSYRISRTSGGAFSLNVGTGPLKALGVGEWCEVVYDGSAYYLAAFGSL